MGTTPTYGFPFPEPDDEPDGPEQIGALAEAADSSLAAHAEATADVHGIADMGALETQDGAAQKASDAVAGQWMSFTVKVAPTQAIIDRTDQAATLTVSNTAFRGLFFHIHNGSLSSTATLPRWRNMRVDPV